MMNNKRIILWMACVLLLAACKTSGNVPAATIQAQITQTMQAVATEAQATLVAAAPIAAPATKAPLPTNTPLPTEKPAPTQTPAPTETPLPTQAPTLAATATSAPAGAANSNTTAHVLLNTNCRSGPSEAYPIVFVALKGQDLNIVSRTILNDYIYIKDPKNPAQSCWLWSKNANITGDFAGLPEITPPPTPIPALQFTAAYVKTIPCVGYSVWSLEFKLENTGSTQMQSYKIVVSDQTTGTTLTSSQNQFGELVNCVVPNSVDYLNPGKSGFIYADGFTYDPYQHTLLVYITLCSHNDVAGACESEGYFITP